MPDIIDASLFPYSDFNKVNLDYLLDIYNEIQEKLDNGELNGPPGESAYQYAVSKGYTGSEDDFATLMASYATVASQAANSATLAGNSATAAGNSATLAGSSATAAANSATLAGNSATAAAGSSANAGTSETNCYIAQNNCNLLKTLSESWAVGGTGSRAGEDTNNSKYYARLASNFQPIETKSGSLVTFTDGAYNVPIDELIISVDPEQDFNGYSKPWPYGGGENRWNEQWELGSFNTTTGEDVVVNNQIRAKNLIPVSPNTNYYFCSPAVAWFLPFDIDGNVLASSYMSTTTSGNASNLAKNAVFTTPANCYYLRFYYTTAYGTTYLNSTAINYPSTVTTYSPYENICPITGWTKATIYHSGEDTSNPDELEISWTDEAGTVYGGTLDVTTGLLTVTHELADLGEITWGKDTGRPGIFYGSITGRKNMSGIIACTQYEVKNIGVSTSPDFYISGYQSYGGGTVFVRDTRYAGSTKEAFKAAMSGVYAIYELATPIAYQLTPLEIATLLGINNFWADTGDISITYRADPALYTNGRIRDLMQTIAPIEDGDTASTAYSSGKYFYHKGEFCKAKTNIASGATFTLNTNYEVTTVAEELYTALH